MNSWIVCKSKDKNQLSKKFIPLGYNILTSLNVATFYKDDGLFENDCLFSVDERLMIISDGIILNLCELIKENKVVSLRELYYFYMNQEELPFKHFIGPFSGFIYQIDKNRMFGFGNQTGDAPVFYFYENDTLLVSNEFNLIIEALKYLGITYAFNQKAAMYAMTFGYMIDDSTFIESIYRLDPGKYFIINERGDFTLETYNTFNFADKEMSFDEAVEKVDEGFRKALKRCFDKDIEYGYSEHLVDMSGGLDSRMVNWVAKDMGYDSLFNICYCQSNSKELSCASKTAYALKNTFLNLQLDDANFVFDIDQIIDMNYGLAFYSGITGGKEMLSKINNRKFGLEHTGQLGDVVLGSFSDEPVHSKPNQNIRRFSRTVKYDVSNSIIEKYHTNEEFAFYNRGFRGVLSTHLIRRHFNCAVSPFLDVEFLNMCMSIPMEYRMHHRLYWAWIDRKYPQASRIPSTRERSHLRTRMHSWKRDAKLKLRKIGKMSGLIKNATISEGMNPYDYWMESDPRITEFVGEYSSLNHIVIDRYPKIGEAINQLMKSENARDTFLALTVIGVLKRYFCDDKGDIIQE